jgi:hypothetical protein
MKRTASQTTNTTLAAFDRAISHRHPVTVTYLLPEKRRVFAVKANGTTTVRTVTTGRFTEWVLTIEPHSVHTSSAGNLLVTGLDRTTDDYVSLRVDRIATYTRHRTTFTADHAPAEETQDPAPTLDTLAEIIAFELGRDDPEYATDGYAHDLAAELADELGINLAA